MKVSELINQLQALPDFEQADVKLLQDGKMIDTAVVNLRTEEGKQLVILASQEEYQRFTDSEE